MAGGVLVVEDDEDIRADLAAILRVKGFTVDEAANGKEALARLRDGARPCVIVLDLMMPVMNGWELRTAMLGEQQLGRHPGRRRQRQGAHRRPTRRRRWRRPPCWSNRSSSPSCSSWSRATVRAARLVGAAVNPPATIDLLGRLDAVAFAADAKTLRITFAAGGALARLGFTADDCHRRRAVPGQAPAPRRSRAVPRRSCATSPATARSASSSTAWSPPTAPSAGSAPRCTPAPSEGQVLGLMIDVTDARRTAAGAARRREPAAPGRQQRAGARSSPSTRTASSRSPRAAACARSACSRATASAATSSTLYPRGDRAARASPAARSPARS